MANQEQLAILKQGSDVWNKWRVENSVIGVDLSQADLSKLELNGVDLRAADLFGANFRGADLRRANLSKADLRGADLRGANLKGSDLTEANLARAELGEANLTGANLTGADLQQAQLSRTTLNRANLSRANLHAANLRGVRLNEADLSKANLSEADLTEAGLRGADLSEADFTGANLLVTDLRYATLTRVNFQWAHLNGTYLRREDLKAAEELGTDFSGGSLVHADINGSPDDTHSSWSRSHRLDRLPSFSRSEAPADKAYDTNERILPEKGEVYFTAIYPKEGNVDTWHTLLAYAHILSAIEAVERDARRFMDQLGPPKAVRTPSFTPIARGTEITIIPSCEKIVFNPKRIAVKWLEDYHRAEFRFRADPSLANDAARGQINIYVGPLLVGNLKFAMLFQEPARAITPLNLEYTRMYRQEEIFVSYSHKDSAIVLACKKAYEALGFNVLIDIDTLRSGQVWNDELMNMINRSTIFQLFWSQNSYQSKYCQQEWEHALKRNKEGFIRPVYWEIPMPKPPEELSKYHFEFMEFEQGQG